LPALVGREEELELMLRRWHRATAGDGQIVLLSGEAGIGKSRIIAAFEERLSVEHHTAMRYFCSPHHQDSTLYPVIAQLERAARFAHEDTAEARLDKLEALLSQSGESQIEEIALLADLLGLPAEHRYPPTPGDPQRKRELTLSAFVHQLEGHARQRPVLALFEDMHWIDSTTLELLDMVVGRVPHLPVMLCITCRPEFHPPWTGLAHVSTLTLGRLGQREASMLVAGVAGHKALPDEIMQRIIGRADGIPLFVEELTKTLLEGGMLREEDDRYVLDGSLPAFAIPSSLHASLMARLDRLSPVKEIAQIGAAIGREFSYELVAGLARRKIGSCARRSISSSPRASSSDGAARLRSPMFLSMPWCKMPPMAAYCVGRARICMLASARCWNSVFPRPPPRNRKSSRITTPRPVSPIRRSITGAERGSAHCGARPMSRGSPT